MTAPRIGPTPLRYHFVRLVFKGIVSSYVRTSVVGTDNLPASGPYIICFNHPSWLDPIYLAATWPDPDRRLFIFGPREQDMSTGVRNQLIAWTGRAVPFQPQAGDIRDATRRAVAVLRAGDCLAIAGEGRLSDLEGQVRPLETGLAHFARMANAPIVPTAIVGTRWVHFGSSVSARIGTPVHAADFPRGKEGAAQMTEVVQEQLQGLLAGVEEREPPGWFGRTLSEAFNDRSWLEGAEGLDAAEDLAGPPDEA